MNANDTQYSKFWMGDDDFQFDPKKSVDLWDTDTLLRLASFKRAVANFVHIITGKDIPVVYNTGEMSYTDGSRVVLSAKLEQNQFDTAVGTALHEASHCVLTDQKLHEQMDRYQKHVLYLISKGSDASALAYCLGKTLIATWGNVLPVGEPYRDIIIAGIDHDAVFRTLTALYNNSNRVRTAVITDSEITQKFWGMSKMMENWVEDRRIDYFQFTTSPGYKGYYNALYDAYFRSKLIDKGILAKNYARTETWESYTFRIINMMNHNTDLDALKGLREIWKVLDVTHINRLTGVLDSWNIGYKIIDIAMKYITLDAEKPQDSPAPGGDSAPTPETDEGNLDFAPPSGAEGSQPSGADDDADSGSDSGDDAKGGKSGVGDADDDDKDDGSDTPAEDKSDLTEPQLKRMNKEIQKQKNFLDGEFPSKKMEKKVAEAIKSLEQSGITIDSVGQGILDGSGRPVKVQCVVIRKVTRELMKGGVFHHMFRSPSESSIGEDSLYQKAIDNGFRLGTMLGKRLQLRNEARTTKYNRLDSGRIDKKLLASLGYDNARVFSRLVVDKFNPLMLHISVDASGSMGGVKWERTMTLVTAIIKAASMTTNLSVVVSVRGTTDGAGFRGSRRRRNSMVSAGYTISVRPLIAIVYDSRVDKLSKVKSLFKYIEPRGATPEGLAFEPIIDDMVAGKDGEMESIFLNISDGQPQFSAAISTGDGHSSSLHYAQETASTHTASMVQKMRALNIKILSYFISGDQYEPSEPWFCFKHCYGKDAVKIDVSSVMQIARTLNERFMSKQ